MSEAQEKTVKLLDSKLDAAVIKTVTTCAIVMIVAVLIHDGDHIRQALNWGYSIPLSLWVLNLTVYVLPVVTLFLARSGRPSATLVGAVADGVISHPAPLRLVHGQLGRVELLVFCADQRCHVQRRVLSGRGLAELGAAVSHPGVLPAVLVGVLPAVSEAETRCSQVTSPSRVPPAAMPRVRSAAGCGC